MKIVISQKALKQLKKLPKIPQIAITEKVKRLKDSKVSSFEKLAGKKNAYKTRVDAYRIVFIKNKNTLHIVSLGHRKDIYKIVDKFLKNK